MWKRLPDKDKRIHHGDDYAGDAWLNTESGEIKYTVVGYDLAGMEYVKQKLLNKGGIPVLRHLLDLLAISLFVVTLLLWAAVISH